MAEHYLKEIRSVRPSGPYKLIGLSMGCVVAYEMAQQLTRLGEEVSLLALLDGGCAEKRIDFFAEGYKEELIQWQERHVLKQLRNLGAPDEELLRLSPEKRVELYHEKIKAVESLPDDITLAQFNRFLEIFAINTRASLSYRPSPYDGRITFIRSSIPEDYDGSYGWSEFAAGGLDIYEIPGGHAEFIKEPGVFRLAEIFRSAAGSSDQDPSTRSAALG